MQRLRCMTCVLRAQADNFCMPTIEQALCNVLMPRVLVTSEVRLPLGGYMRIPCKNFEGKYPPVHSPVRVGLAKGTRWTLLMLRDVWCVNTGLS